MGHETLESFHAAQDAGASAVCDALRVIIDVELPEAESRIWHAHPVWFLAGNPIVGYSVLKSGVRLMFWSGQSFGAPGLTPTGTFKAAEARFTSPEQIDRAAMAAWLAESRRIQWDYKNIVKRRGELVRLT